MDRLAVLGGHLTPAVPPSATPAPAAAPLGPPLPVVGPPPFDTAALARHLCTDNYDLRQRLLKFLEDPLFAPSYGASLPDFRELTLQRLKAFVAQRFFSVRDYTRDPEKFMACLETLALADYSLCIKAGVHFTLCGGTIAKLGTERHSLFLDGIDSLSLPGCFSMSELGHGSNVMGIETTAVYDAGRQEFVLRTPTNTASKFWIGGAGQHAKISAVFAQLTVAGAYVGPHVFVVRLRDDAGRLCPGVRIKDCGAKAGLNGVDNGQLWFDGVRVPRAALLNKYADVAPDGAYTSPIPTVGARFGVTVGGLTSGRVLIAQGAVNGAALATTIALRFASSRTQFADGSGKEVPILTYPTTRERLLPALASTLAHHAAIGRLKKLFAGGGDPKEVHILSSCLKASATWARRDSQQAARECCGGMGFLSANRIGEYRNDQDVDVTFEGDNTVLMQQVAKALVDAATSGGKAAPAPPPAPPAGDAGCPRHLLALARHREAVLVHALASELAAAGAAGGKAAAAAAYDLNMDVAAEIGVARADVETIAALTAAADAAPPDAAPFLRLAAVVHGVARARAAGAGHVASGAVPGARGLAALRSAARSAQALLCADGGAPALALAAGFGIPDTLLHAPIAGDWRAIGV